MAARYILSLCAAALVGGILMELNREGATGRVMKLLCGLFLMLTALGPFGKLKLPDLEGWNTQWREEAEAAVAEGEAYLEKARQAGISERLTAYILDKAAERHLELRAHVTLTEDGRPETVTLRGSPSEAQRLEMEDCLEAELGIPKGAVRWMEP